MADNKKREAIGRVKTRLEQAVATVGSNTASQPQRTPGTVESGRSGMSDVVSGLAGAWDSPKAEEIAAVINIDVTTLRTKMDQALGAATSAEAAETDTDVPDDDDRAKPKWDA